MNHYTCKKCGENFHTAMNVKKELCNACNPKNWKKGDKLIAIKDSGYNFYKIGDVFTFDSLKNSSLFYEDEKNEEYFTENFKLFAKKVTHKKDIEIKVGDIIVHISQNQHYGNYEYVIKSDNGLYVGEEK
ncbi:MAG: hypothetical protein ACOCP8_09260, partial [archaeon]